MGGFLWTMLHYPGAVVGLTIILALVAVSFYTIRTLPLSEAIALWRGEEDVWARNPRNALPTWVNAFRRHDLPPTIAVGPDSPSYEKERIDLTPEMTEVVIRLPVDYDYGAPPQEISLYLDASYEAKLPLTTLIWRTPDGRQIELTNFNPRRSHTYHFSQDSRLQRRLRGLSPVTGLLAPPEGEAGTVLAGRYVLEVSTLVFEDASDVDVEWVLTGQVYGLAGTDASRRDLMVALLWGTPIALAFGVVAAVATSVGGMIFAALGAWMGGVVDRAIQFLTELNLVLPFFPVSLMVYTLYSKSIWAILGVTVALTLFGSGIKTYRAVFLQVKESPYIEAARAYGASDWRIVRHYLIPRIVAVLVPRLVILVPAYVFLEATLAFLGVSDPAIPTWGKLVVAALSYGIHSGAYHLVLASLGLLMLTGFAFALLGLSLERVFEPRLRRS